MGAEGDDCYRYLAKGKTISFFVVCLDRVRLSQKIRPSDRFGNIAVSATSHTFTLS